MSETLKWLRDLLLPCRHIYEPVSCDTPGWEFEECQKCGHLHTLRRPGGTITISRPKTGASS